MKTIKPANNQLFCKIDKAETQTKSGILLTEAAVEKPKTAIVINVGANVTQYERDDQIIYKAYSTTELTLPDEEDVKIGFFLIAEEDVLGTVIEVANEDPRNT